MEHRKGLCQRPCEPQVGTAAECALITKNTNPTQKTTWGDRRTFLPTWLSSGRNKYHTFPATWGRSRWSPARPLPSTLRPGAETFSALRPGPEAPSAPAPAQKHPACSWTPPGPLPPRPAPDPRALSRSSRPLSPSSRPLPPPAFPASGLGPAPPASHPRASPGVPRRLPAPAGAHPAGGRGTGWPCSRRSRATFQKRFWLLGSGLDHRAPRGPDQADQAWEPAGAKYVRIVDISAAR